MGSACCGGKKQDDSVMERCSKVTVKRKNPLLLIDGYLKEPLVSLEEALQPFHGKIDHLSDHIKVAKKQCRFPNKHGLTHDESAAIYIYTMKWSNGCVYDQLQEAWNSENSSKLKPWFKYLKLFKTAFDKLPIVTTEVWQGTANGEELIEITKSKSVVMYSSMGSCLPSSNEINEYIKKTHGTKKVVTGYTSVEGRDVTGYTCGHSKEVMIMPGVKLGLSKITGSDPSMVFIHFQKWIENHKPNPPKHNAPKSAATTPEISSNTKHFSCPTTGCGNVCAEDHEGDHCHGFAMLLHPCHHHCGPSPRCDKPKCKRDIHTLYRCYNCGRSYCMKHCFK